MDSVDDNKLVEEFLGGNELAFNKLVKKYSPKIYWHARGMVNNHLDADEITQEVLLVIYQKLETFKFDSKLYTWIYRITATRSLNLLRKRRLTNFFSISDDKYNELEDAEDIQNNFEKKDEIKRIEKALQKLPIKQREVFVLKNFEELTYKEISEISGKSIGGLKANYFHALKKITELIKNEG